MNGCGPCAEPALSGLHAELKIYSLRMTAQCAHCFDVSAQLIQYIYTCTGRGCSHSDCLVESWGKKMEGPSRARTVWPSTYPGHQGASFSRSDLVFTGPCMYRALAARTAEDSGSAAEGKAKELAKKVISRLLMKHHMPLLTFWFCLRAWDGWCVHRLVTSALQCRTGT